MGSVGKAQFKLLLEHCKERMSIDAMEDNDPDDDASDDTDTEGPWTGSDPALVIGFRGEYRELRVACFAARRTTVHRVSQPATA